MRVGWEAEGMMHQDVMLFHTDLEGEKRSVLRQIAEVEKVLLCATATRPVQDLRGLLSYGEQVVQDCVARTDFLEGHMKGTKSY